MVQFHKVVSKRYQIDLDKTMSNSRLPPPMPKFVEMDNLTGTDMSIA